MAARVGSWDTVTTVRRELGRDVCGMHRRCGYRVEEESCSWCSVEALGMRLGDWFEGAEYFFKQLGIRNKGEGRMRKKENII